MGSQCGIQAGTLWLTGGSIHPVRGTVSSAHPAPLHSRGKLSENLKVRLIDLADLVVIGRPKQEFSAGRDDLYRTKNTRRLKTRAQSNVRAGDAVSNSIWLNVGEACSLSQA